MATDSVLLYQSIPAFEHLVFTYVGRFPATQAARWKRHFETHSAWFEGQQFKVLLLVGSRPQQHAARDRVVSQDA